MKSLGKGEEDMKFRFRVFFVFFCIFAFLAFTRGTWVQTRKWRLGIPIIYLSQIAFAISNSTHIALSNEDHRTTELKMIELTAGYKCDLAMTYSYWCAPIMSQVDAAR
jgi:hypothetical protein